MNRIDFIFTGWYFGAFVFFNIIISLLSILDEDLDFKPSTNRKEAIFLSITVALISFLLPFLLLGLNYYIERDNVLSIILIGIIYATLSLIVMMKTKLFLLFETSTKYLLILPVKTFMKNFVIRPFKFLAKRQWGEIFLWSLLVVCLTRATYFIFDIKFFSKNSALLLLAVILVVGTVLVFRRSYKR